MQDVWKRAWRKRRKKSGSDREILRKAREPESWGLIEGDWFLKIVRNVFFVILLTLEQAEKREFRTMEESSPYSPYGEKKEKERPVRLGKKEWRKDIEDYFNGNLWKVGESPNPYSQRSDPGDHHPFFFIERSGKACRNVWATLRFSDVNRPSWLKKDDPVKVFLPLVYILEVPGEPVASLELDGKRFTAVAAGARGIRFSFDPVHAIDCHLAEVNGSLWRPFTWRLEIRSRALHHRMNRYLEHRTMKKRREDILAEAPGTGFIARGQDCLRWLIRESLRMAGARNTDLRPLWPEGRTCAACVTHETSAPLQGKWVKEIVRLEKEKGISSTWFIPGEGSPERQAGFLDQLMSSGSEVALLGDVFIPPMAFSSDIAFRHYLDRCRTFIERWEVRGFRSSAMLSSPIMRKVLGEFSLYDSSTTDLDPFYPTTPVRGCNSVHPFRIYGALEIPVTLADPEKLAALGLSPGEILDLWKKKLHWIKEMGGLMVFRACHTRNLLSMKRRSGLSRWMSMYRNLLDMISRDEQVWQTTLGAVSDLCKER